MNKKPTSTNLHTFPHRYPTTVNTQSKQQQPHVITKSSRSISLCSLSSTLSSTQRSNRLLADTRCNSKYNTPFTASYRSNSTSSPSNTQRQPTVSDGIRSKFLSIKERISVAIERVSMNPSTPEEKAAYTRMVHTHEQRYAAGEAAAVQAHRKKVWQDHVDGGVFHVPPGIDPEQFRKADAPAIKIKVNEDGSYSFTTDDGDEARTKPHVAPEGEKLAQDVESLGAHLSQEAHDAKKPHGTETTAGASSTAIGKIQDPRLVIAFTCDVCETRSVKSMPKRSYEHGVVLIRCECCTTDHLIADHLGWFDNDGAGIDIEKIMHEKGQDVIKASVDLDGVSGIDAKLSPDVVDKIQQTLQKARQEDLQQPIGGKFKHFEDHINTNDVGDEPVKLALKH